jgi:hypothetical protein
MRLLNSALRKATPCLFLAALFALSANAGVLTWTLHDATFSDNLAYAGSFDFDSSTWTVSNWDISVPVDAYAGFPSGFDYNDSNSTVSANEHLDAGGGLRWWTILFQTEDRGLRLGFDSFLPDAGGQVDLDLEETSEYMLHTRGGTSGYVEADASAAPEPASIFLTGGAGLLALFMRRRAARSRS